MQCLDSEGVPFAGQSPGSLGLNKFFTSLCLGGALLLGICTQASATFRIQTIPATAPAAEPAPAREVIDRALGALGIPYRWGGTSPRQGFDCSGLVQYAFKTQSDLDLPRTSRALSRLDAPLVKRSDLQPGDLLFFRIRSRSVDHVAIYLGDGRFIHAPRRGSNVRIDHLSNAYWQRHFQLAKRVVPEA
ncbi:MAG: C40 family peptidase [Pseudomonadota bacterium]